MPRSIERCCLQDGLKLDLNHLIHERRVRRGGVAYGARVAWNHSYWGQVAACTLSADMSGDHSGWFSVKLDGEREQRVHLIASPRHYGGAQWYFLCPVTGTKASVLWRPSGATRFASRAAWGRQVAYRSQFLDRDSRAHHAQAKIKNRLCQLGGFDPDEWDLPPKPKWMRHRTYARLEARFEQGEEVLNDGMAALAARFMGR